jgi:DNA (cytosine-5)-methyltransferase 1
MRDDCALTFIDLFAGAGGLSLGFSRAGFSCAGAVENSLPASSTYQKNFPEHAVCPLTRLGPVNGNILSLKRETVERALRDMGLTEVDVLVGGPPCQGFSRVGRAKLDHLATCDGSSKTDPRNSLYLKFLDVLKWTRPRAFLFENVPGILDLRGMNVAEAICEAASSGGYRVLSTILNAAWYGVPQTRDRVFILGIRSDLGLAPSFPAPIYRAQLTTGHLSESKVLGSIFFKNPAFFVKTNNPIGGRPAISVAEALGDLPPFLQHLTDSTYKSDRTRFPPRRYRPGRPSTYASLMRNWDEKFSSRSASDHYCRFTPRDFETFGLMRPGDKYPDAVRIAEKQFEKAKVQYRKGLLSQPPERRNFVPPYRLGSFDEKWWKLVPSLPSWTITAHLSRDGYSHIHYDAQKRSITVREAARLQSFPDAFVFSGNTGDCFTQIGNAVPPLLAFALATHMRSLLKPTNNRR